MKKYDVAIIGAGTSGLTARREVAKQTNNYETYKRFVEASRIPSIDLNQYLLEMKDTASFPLYTKANTHWSAYALYHVVDTLVNTMETILDKDLPDFSFHTPRIESKARGTDAGMFDSFNHRYGKQR